MDKTDKQSLAEKTQLQDEAAKRQQIRHRRRVRNQILCYIFSFLLLAGVCTGGYFGVNAFRNSVSQRQKEEEKQQEMMNQLLEQESRQEEQMEEPEETPVPEMTREQKLDEIVTAAIQVMPLEDKVAGLFYVTPEAITGVSSAIKAGDGTREALAQYAVGGLIYGQKNIQSAEQIREMLDNTALYSRYPVFLGLCEEGGKMSVLSSAGVMEDVPSALECVNTENGSVEKAMTTIGETMAQLGFDFNFAPVCNVGDGQKSYLKNRMYGGDCAVVEEAVCTAVDSLERAGISSCLTYFPGGADAEEDPSEVRSTSMMTKDTFHAGVGEVFRKGIEAGAKAVAMSCEAAPEMTGNDEPCTFSEALVTECLRGELEFDGIILSGDLSSKAVSEYYGADEASILALKAGCDMIWNPEDFEKAYTGVLNAVKENIISEQRVDDALKRIYRVKFENRVE